MYTVMMYAEGENGKIFTVVGYGKEWGFLPPRHINKTLGCLRISNGFALTGISDVDSNVYT